MGSEARVEISGAEDIIAARQHSRALAAKLGFSGSEGTLIVAAVSEVARNIVEYARRGEMMFDCVHRGKRRGLQIIAQDRGPGIADMEQALRYGNSSRNGSGAGLPAARWLMDEFEIVSRPGQGTKVTTPNAPNKHRKEQAGALNSRHHSPPTKCQDA